MKARHCSVCRSTAHDRRFHERRNPLEGAFTDANGVVHPIRGSAGYSEAKRERIDRQKAKGAPATRKAARIEEERRRPRLSDDADAALRAAAEPFGKLDGFSAGAIRAAQAKADRGYIPKARLVASRLRLEMNRRK